MRGSLRGNDDLARGQDLGYQPALDGLRAIAVLAVVLYHDDYTWARGGFLGVDAFFVLSGFLITSLLLAEYRRRESIALVAFWGRRLRRLLPALLVVLLAVAALCASAIPIVELARVRGDAIASLLYVTNWRFIVSGDSYFAVFSTPSPVMHLWSLAIEEQFYLVWPIVVFACLRAARGSRRVLLTVTVAGLVASTAAMAAFYRSSDASRSYYGTDTRMHTIFVGALLALLLTTRWPRRPRSARGAAAAGTLGAIAVVWMMHTVSGQSAVYYRGGSLLFALAVAAIIAGAVVPRRSPVRAALAFAPLVWIGRISYGVYLWHWPVDVFLTAERVGLSGTPLNLVRLTITFVFAIASYYAIEMPVRRGALRPRFALPLAPISIGVVAVVLVAATSAAVPLPSYLGGGALPATAQHLDTETRSQPTDRPRPKQGLGAQVNIEPYPCGPPTDYERSTVQRAVQADGPPPAALPGGPLRVLVVGDSLACSVALGLGPAGEPALDVRKAVMLGCGVVSDEVWDSSDPFPKGTDHCHALVASQETKAIAEFSPEVVLWVSTWERFPLVDHGLVLETGTPPWRRVLGKRLDTAFRFLTRNGAHLFVATVAAGAPTGVLLGQRVTSARFDWRFTDMNKELAAFVDRHRPAASLLDIAGKVCPHGPPCPAHVGDVEPRKFDGFHFDPAGSVWISRWMLPKLLAVASDRPPR